jgi:prepilin-type N-terminal cleavage/methylation domain-containing protein
MMNKLFKQIKKDGFTLVEVLVASVILAIAVGSVITMFVRSHTIEIEQKRLEGAMSIADSIMEHRFCYVPVKIFDAWTNNVDQAGYLKSDDTTISSTPVDYIDSVIIDSSSMTVKGNVQVEIKQGSTVYPGVTIPHYEIKVIVRWGDSLVFNLERKVERLQEG